MILNLIILASICQIVLYILSDNKNWKYGKMATFLFILLGHLFIFPPFFFPEFVEGGINCGMPALGITLGFWVIGGGSTLIIHLAYYLFSRFAQS